MKSSLYVYNLVCVVFAVAVVANCDHRVVDNIYEPTVSAGLEIKLCQKEDGGPDHNVCPCRQHCAKSYAYKDSSGLWICAAGCISNADCPPETTCNAEGSCSPTGVTDENEGTCLRGEEQYPIVVADVSGGDTGGGDTTDLDADGDGYTVAEGDCDDTDAAVHPGATERCDGVDNDCDGNVDEGCQVDADHDGSFLPADCDDHNNTVYPGAPERCDELDNDCDGQTDEGCIVDEDGDGYSPPIDCDDTDFSIHPAALEICDDIDNDCDGLTDEGCPGNQPVCGNGQCETGETQQTCPVDCHDPVIDADGDGYEPPADCDDTNFYVNPGRAEQCGDGIDNDCDGVAEEGCGPICGNGSCESGESCPTCPQDCCTTPPIDADGDGYSPPADCNDYHFFIHPYANEVCDTIDNDCDGQTDEGCQVGPICGDDICQSGETHANCPADCPDDGPVDADGDGYSPPADCLDTNFYVHPGATEVCDGLDNNCDGQADEGVCGPICGDDICSQSESHATCPQDCPDNQVDLDHDGYNSTVDCDDTDFYVHPNASEVCDGKDNDCDSLTDEGVCGAVCGNEVCEQGENSDNCLQDCPIDQVDVDGDGHYVPADCNDHNFHVHPGAAETCDGVDNDCDSLTDEGCAYCGDGTCQSGETAQSCPQDCGYVCGNGAIESGEVCDGILFGGQTCQSKGFDAGTLTCVAGCTSISTANCYDVGPECGNGSIESGEVCDGVNFGGKTCQYYNFDAGTLACTNSCQTISTSGCYDVGPVCGNNILEAGEECDGTKFGGKTCQYYNFDSGSLTCTSSCDISTSNCYDDTVDDQSNWVAKPCENGWDCIELNGKYLSFSPNIYVVGHCPPLGLHDYSGLYNPADLLQVYDTDGDGYYELWLDDASYTAECEINWIRPDPSSSNNWSWAQYEGQCLGNSNIDPVEYCGPYLNCGYSADIDEYVCNVHFETPDGDPAGEIEYTAQYPSTW
ncbi:MAG: putative metal-binding motif-containing protein [Patescibacteria group bacterium]